MLQGNHRVEHASSRWCCVQALFHKLEPGIWISHSLRIFTMGEHLHIYCFYLFLLSRGHKNRTVDNLNYLQYFATWTLISFRRYPLIPVRTRSKESNLPRVPFEAGPNAQTNHGYAQIDLKNQDKDAQDAGPKGWLVKAQWHRMLCTMWNMRELDRNRILGRSKASAKMSQLWSLYENCQVAAGTTCGSCYTSRFVQRPATVFRSLWLDALSRT